jgi:uncharacterized protein DUF4386
MNTLRSNTRIAGILLIVGLIVGIFSVAPVIDSTEYLSGAAENPNQVIIAAVFQFIMSLAYLGFALFLYPILKNKNQGLALGFLSFRIIASTLIITGTIILLSILALSQEYVRILPQDSSNFEALGYFLKSVRDLINHVFMILVLCLGNMLFYIIMMKSRFIPLWLSIWGGVGALFSVLASLLVLFGSMEIITSGYLILNIPTALLEFVLAGWLILKGFDKTIQY